MNNWIEQEFSTLNLGDKRRNKRYTHILDLFVNQPESKVPSVSSNPYEVKAIYNFWKSNNIEEYKLIQPHYSSTSERAKAYNELLAIHDTTNIAFASSAEGLGYLDHGKGDGVMLHSCLLAGDDGQPLGLLHQEIWTRDYATIGKKKDRAKKDITEKESYRWLKGIEGASAEIGEIQEGRKVIHISDRESDIYELLSMKREVNQELLIRATHDRKTQEGYKLWENLRKQVPCTQINIDVKQKDKDEKTRTAHLDVFHAKVELLPPSTKSGKGKSAIVMNAILAEETNPPENADKISWMLLTTLDIETADEAVKCVKRYSKRWLIERYHFVLKSGCKVEELQLRHVKQLRTALITFSIVAYRLMQLTYTARINPTKVCEGELSKDEWQALYCIIKQTNNIPETPPTVKEVVLWVSKLGGFIGRKGDGEPGLKVLWRGMKRLNDITQAWVLFNKLSFG